MTLVAGQRVPWAWGPPDVDSTAESAALEARAGEGWRQPAMTGPRAEHPLLPGLASPRSLLWTRPDGQVRLLEHLGGPPAEPEPEGPWERRLDALDALLPGWDDALILGVIAALFSVVLVQMV